MLNVFRLLLQTKNFFEFFVVTRVVLGETDVAHVKLDAFFLQFVRLDALAG